MNKQVVIAGLLGAMAGAQDADPTPCEDINTKASYEAVAAAEGSLEAWEGKLEALEEASEADALLALSAQESYDDVTGAVLPFYTAMNDAYDAWQAQVGVKQAAQEILTAIETGAANTISGQSMLLGEGAPTVAAALLTVEDAQSDYDTKYAEINDATYTDADSASETGFRAYLANEVKQEALMDDAEEAASTAEATAISNYEAQEAVVNALLVLEGCAEVLYADLSTAEESANADGTAGAEAEELLKFQVCCNTRLSTYLTAESSAEGCTANVRFGMEGERQTRLASQTTLETTYNDYCTSSQSAGATESCDGEVEYTDYKTAYAGVMKARRMRDVIDGACTDYRASPAVTATYDCSSGILSNSGTLITAGNTAYHLLQDSTGNNPAAVDTIWTYRQTVNVLAGGNDTDTTTANTLYSTKASTWETEYETMVNHLKDWTVAEARYWAYEAAWEIHNQLITDGDTAEDALQVTRDQKIDLLDAADANKLAADKLVSMATSDLADEVDALATLQGVVVAAEEAHAVQVYLAAQADAAALVQSTIVADWSEVCGDSGEEATCYNALSQLETLYDTAVSNFNDIQASLDCTSFDGTDCTGFYRTARDEATMFAGMSAEAYGNAEMMVGEAEGNIMFGLAMWATSVAACKGLGYDKAQAAKKALMDLVAENEAAAAEVLAVYETKSAFSETGETNTLCAYPAKGSDGSQEPRPECKDGYCCGAAQKFLRDGTKLAIETCQKAEGVHTYEYFPPLPEGSPVEPTPETWRFQCISGAQKLAATAAAALAASYMMA